MTTLRIDPLLDAPPRRRPARTWTWIGGAFLLSLAAHTALIGAGVVLVGYRKPIVLMPLEIPATIQLEMSPPGGATPPAAKPQPATPPSPEPVAQAATAPTSKPMAQAATPRPPKPATHSATSTPAKATAQAAAPPPANLTAEAGGAQAPAAPPSPVAAQLSAPQASETRNSHAAQPHPLEPKSAAAASPPAQATPQPEATIAKAAQPQTPTARPPPPPPAPPEQAAGDSKLTFDFASVESDTNALVTGDLLVPPKPDAKYHNRKPSYPLDAAWRGEQGTVVLLIHVTPDGLVSGVDVLRSSGFGELDHAAEDAVLTWHFLPSVRAGQAVPAAMRMGFVFGLD